MAIIDVASVKIRPDLTGFRTELRAQLSKIDTDFTVQVKTAIDTTRASTELDAFKARQEATPIHKRLDVDRSALDLVGRTLANIGGSALAAAGKVTLIGTASIGVVGAVQAILVTAGALGPLLVQALGTAWLLPGAVMALAGPLAAVLLGLDGIKAAFSGVKSTLDPLKSAVSSTFETGLRPAVANINAILPQLTGGLQGIAAELSSVFTGMTAAFNQPQQILVLQALLDNVRVVIGNVGAALAPLGVAFMNIAMIGASALGELTSGLGGAAQRFADFTTSAQGAQKIAGWIQGGIDAFRQLWAILTTVASVAVNIFSALQAGGAGLGASFMPALQSLQAMTAQGGALYPVFQALGTAIAQVGQIAGPMFTSLLTSLAPLITALVPIVTTLAQAFSGALVNAVAILAPPLTQLAQVLLPALSTILNAVSPVIGVIASLFASLIAALTPIVPLFAQLATMLLPVFQQIITAMQPLLLMLAQAFMGIVTALMPLVPPITQFVTALLPPLMAIVQALIPIITLLANAFIQVLGAVMPILPPLQQMIASLVPPLLGLVNALVPVIAAAAGVFVTLVQALVPILPPIMQLITALLPPLVQLIQSLLPFVQQAFVLFGQLLSALMPILPPILQLISALLPPLINLFMTILQPILTVASALTGALASAIGGVVNVIGSIISAVAGFAAAVADGVGAVVNWFAGMPGRIFGAIGDIVGWFFRLGGDIIQGILNGLAGLAQKVGNFVKNAVGSVVDGVKGFLGIGSPSKLFRDEIGKMMVTGLAQGIDRNADHAVAAAQGLAGDVSRAMAAATDPLALRTSGAYTVSAVTPQAVGVDAAPIEQRIERALAGWKWDMDSRGINRLARAGGRANAQR